MTSKNPFDKFVNGELKFTGVPEINCETVHPVMDAMLLTMEENNLVDIDPLVKQLCSCLPVAVLAVNLPDMDKDSLTVNANGQQIITVTVEHLQAMLNEIALLAVFTAPLIPLMWKLRYEENTDDPNHATPAT
jgi:hypothetical protein